MFDRALGAMYGWRGGSGAVTGAGVAGAPVNAGSAPEPGPWGIGMAAAAAGAAAATAASRNKTPTLGISRIMPKMCGIDRDDTRFVARSWPYRAHRTRAVLATREAWPLDSRGLDSDVRGTAHPWRAAAS